MGKGTGYFSFPKTVPRAAAVPVKNILRIEEAELEITYNHDLARARIFLTGGGTTGRESILEIKNIR